MSRFGLLVIVIGLVMIVSIVVFPIVATAPTIDRKIPCLSNLKQSAIALIMYSTDWNDRLPDRDKWMDLTLEYSKNEEIYRCPEVAKLNPKQFGYAFNSKLSFAKLGEDMSPVPMVYDSVNLARNASDPVTSLPDLPRHDKVNYMAFTDSHTKPLRAGSNP